MPKLIMLILVIFPCSVFAAEPTGRTVRDLIAGLNSTNEITREKYAMYFQGVLDATMLYGIKPGMWCPEKKLSPKEFMSAKMHLKHLLEDVAVYEKYGHLEILDIGVDEMLSKTWDMRYACPERQKLIKEKAKNKLGGVLDEMWKLEPSQ